MAAVGARSLRPAIVVRSSPHACADFAGIFDSLDILIRPLALDEISMTGSPDSIPKLLDIASSDGISGYVRLKAVEALGRLRASAAESSAANDIGSEAGLALAVSPPSFASLPRRLCCASIPWSRWEKLPPPDRKGETWFWNRLIPKRTALCFRQRRYARLKLSRNLVLTTTNLRENFRLSVPELNLGGGIGAGERHLAPGTLVTLKLTQGVRTIKAQAIVRGARPQAMAFEFVDMDLEDRARLRKILLDLGGLPQASNVASRTRRRGRIAAMK